MGTPLRVIESATQPAPYPPETRAKGWRFELDYERIEQSDTWCLATPEMRPWLLMLWLTAWRQGPCGSLPNNDQLIAARLGMPDRQFVAHRDILMRGWWLAADGRLYHPAITECVSKMIAARAREVEWKREQRERKAKQKQQLSGDVHPDSGGSPVGVHAPEPEPEPDSHSPSPSSKESAARRRAPARLKVEDLVEDGVNAQVAQDWLALRNAKRLPLTPTAWSCVAREAAAAGLTLPEAVRLSVENGWAGFKASWLAREAGRDALAQRDLRRAATDTGESIVQRAARTRMEQWAPQAAAQPPSSQQVWDLNTVVVANEAVLPSLPRGRK
jgi:hypothetical protein